MAEPVLIEGGDLGCARLLVLLRARVAELAEGTVVHLSTSDPIAPIDLPVWCRMTGHEYLGVVAVAGPDEPAADEPAADVPVTDEPDDEPVTDEPAADLPVADDRVDEGADDELDESEDGSPVRRGPVVTYAVRVVGSPTPTDAANPWRRADG